jgi:hypothetical protein
MSRFRFPALLALSLGVVAVLMLRRDRHQAPAVVVPAPAPPAPAAETPQPVAAAPAAPVQQLYPETDGVSDAEPAPSYWQVPVAPPVHWSEPPYRDERQSA